MKQLNNFAIYPYLPILIGAALGYFGQCSSGTCPLTSTWWRGAIYGAVSGNGLSSHVRQNGQSLRRSGTEQAGAN